MIIHVDSLGAAPDGKTDAGPAIRQAIHRAKSLGKPATIQLSKGEYAIWPKNDTYEYRRFGMAAGGEQRCCLLIDHAEDITFAGEGPETVLSIRNPQFGGIAAEFSQNIVLRDFAVDYDPLPFIQGRVASVDEQQDSFVLAVDPGFLGFDHPALAKPDLCFGNTFDPTAPYHRRGRPLFLRGWQRLSNNEWELRAASRTPLHRKGLEVGNRYFHCFIRFNRSPVEAWFVRGARLENITVHAGITIAFLIGHTEETTHIRNCKILKRAGTDRAINVNADGIHSFGVRGDFIIEDCDFRDNYDDSINIHSRGVIIEKVFSDTKVLISSEKFTIRKGDRLLFYDYKTKAPIRMHVTATNVEACEEYEAQTHYVLTFAPPIAGLDTDPSKRVFNWDACGSGVVIRNNTFTNAGGVKLRCPGALVENNRFSFAGGIVMYGIYHYNEGPVPYGVTIRNNALCNGIVAGDRWERPKGERLVRDIQITGNRFRDHGGQVLSLFSCENVVMRGNVATGAVDYAPGAAKGGVRMHNCGSVSIEDLSYTDTRASAACGVRIGKNCDQGDSITLKNVALELPEGAVATIDDR